MIIYGIEISQVGGDIKIMTEKEMITIEKRLVNVMVDVACNRCKLTGDCMDDFDCIYEHIRRDFL